MSRTIRFTSALIALVLTGVSTASAEGVTVNLANKDADTIRADIRRAARTACERELNGSLLAYYELAPCVERSAARAEASIGPMLAALSTHGAHTTGGADAVAIAR